MGNFIFFREFKTFKIFINKITLFYRKLTLFSFQKH